MIAATKVINMPTVALKFRFKKKTKASKPLRLPALQFGSKNFSRKRWR
jgi:hypothetical protein